VEPNPLNPDGTLSSGNPVMFDLTIEG